MKNKKWRLEEKLEILSSSESNGVVVTTCRKYGVSTGTFQSWKKMYKKHGKAGFKPT